jgi:integrase
MEEVRVGLRQRHHLEQQRQLQLSVLEQCGEPFDTDGFIWSKDDVAQEPWRPDTAGKWIKKTGLLAGELRHMTPTQLLASGVPLHPVSSRLGHSRTSTTLDVYAEAIPAHDDDSAAFMGRY